MSPSETRSDLPQQLRAEFVRHFGGDEAPRIFFAPGRINLIGAHLDYSGGSVLPLSVDRGTYVAARLRTDGRIRLRSCDRELAVELRTNAIDSRRDPDHGWASYPLGVWHFFRELTGKDSGIDMLFGGDLPIASGLSSSAAMEVATAMALDALHGTGATAEQWARLGYRAETEFIGLRCGIMDQYASALGRPGKVLLLDCSGPVYRYVPLDEGLFDVLVMDTGVPRNLAGTLFNDRVEECSQAHEILQSVRQRRWLAETTQADLAAATERLAGPLYKRVRHVVDEVQRVHVAVDALTRGDIATLGRMLNESHASTASWYEVSCVELDTITDAARKSEFVYGARLTGAGFGGCAIALVQPGKSRQVEGVVAPAYRRQFGRDPVFTLLREGRGPHECK